MIKTCVTMNIPSETNGMVIEASWCSAAENAKSWFAQWTTHGWWLSGPPQFWAVRQSIIYLLTPWNQLKWSKWANRSLCFTSAQIQTDTWFQCLCATICPVSFRNIDRQMDHRCWDLRSPDGFMGRIWWPCFSSTVMELFNGGPRCPGNRSVPRHLQPYIIKDHDW